MDFYRIKNFAKTKVKENFGSALLLTIIAGICISVSSATYIGPILLSPIFTLSLIHVYIAILAGHKPEIKEVFSGFSDWWCAFKITFFQGLFTSLWSMLFVIPGIIKACAYSQAMYILAGNPEKGALQCLRESEQLMKGQKMRYFFLQLSFIGWWLLVGITFGIAAIWVIPYYNATMATFYIDIMPSTESEEEAPASSQPSSSQPHRTVTFGNKNR